MDSMITYSTGDWVVHSLYGVGQIKGVEVKPIQGEDTNCFQVKTRDCTYWFPTSSMDNPRIRPVASQAIIAKVIQNLRRKAHILDTDRDLWKKKIDEVQANCDLLSISILVRDLYAQQALRTLNQTEKAALKRLEDRLLGEWASIMQVEVEKIRPTFQQYIQESQAKIEVDQT
jgi:RNA polymerase-interacting CarD/CdnL/TRCF family regulator